MRRTRHVITDYPHLASRYCPCRPARAPFPIGVVYAHHEWRTLEVYDPGPPRWVS